ncbi:MAG TPA: 1-(5-phosphoribosyl)-5-[(5-phosphoribosylamino)methylideneamino]imidazole-4-carboxamide isomerase [Gemmatimonadales bacterium]|nr:1-(5-phosphoribosyl)-5-[(5-phosphoribosylamino)methylideneamino]imidazole-4-carboxamide isomerase [Gemmatimonadales bacterium]
MDVLPAIDLRAGNVVRLSQGEASRETVYAGDPVAVAERFTDEGARWLHLVDLDRAFGTGDNTDAVRRVVAAVGGRVQVQLGGGLRSLARIDDALAVGAARVVLGTAAAQDPELVRRAVERAGSDRIAVGIDARDGLVAVRGWTETTAERAESLAARVIAGGAHMLVYTDIARDGMLAGPDLAGAAALQALGAAVILSGGVSSLDDLRAAAAAGLAGAIVGRAVYEGRLSVREAVVEVGSEQ